MFTLRPIPQYRSHADPIWPDGPFKPPHILPVDSSTECFPFNQNSTHPPRIRNFFPPIYFPLAS